MKHLLLFLTIYILDMCALQAQSYFKTSFEFSGDTECRYALELSDSRIAVVGIYEDSQSNGKDVFLAFLNSDGVMENYYCYSLPGNEYLNQIIQTSDGNIVISGLSESGTSDQDGFIFKVALDGSIIWKHSIAGTFKIDHRYIKECSDGGIIGCGNKFVSSTLSYFYMYKLNSDGEEIWQTCQGGAYSQSFGDIYEFDNGDFLVVGSSYNNTWIPMLVKVSSEGIVLWKKGIEVNAAHPFYQIEPTEDGNLIIAGGISLNIFSNVGTDQWVLKINYDGEVLWSKVYGTSSRSMRILGMDRCPDNGFILAACQIINNNNKGGILKIDADGEAMWYKEFIDADQAHLYSAETAADGLVISGWMSDSNEARVGLIFKSDFNGNISQNCSLNDVTIEQADFATSTFLFPDATPNSISISSSPLTLITSEITQGEICVKTSVENWTSNGENLPYLLCNFLDGSNQLQINSSGRINTSICIFDSCGRLCYNTNQTLVEGTNNLSIGALSSGLYYLEINGDEYKYSQKFMIK